MRACSRGSHTHDYARKFSQIITLQIIMRVLMEWDKSEQSSQTVHNFEHIQNVKTNHLFGARPCTRTVMTFDINISMRMNQFIVISLSDVVKLSKKVKLYRKFNVWKWCNISMMRRARVRKSARAILGLEKYF